MKQNEAKILKLVFEVHQFDDQEDVQSVDKIIASVNASRNTSKDADTILQTYTASFS